MARANYIYAVVLPDEEIPVAYFTVKYEAQTWASRHARSYQILGMRVDASKAALWSNAKTVDFNHEDPRQLSLPHTTVPLTKEAISRIR